MKLSWQGSEPRLFGFSRQEWRTAMPADQAAAVDFLFDALEGIRDGDLTPKGFLGGIGYSELVCLARVSPEFADRVAAELTALDPAWRQRLGAPTGGSPEQEAVRAELRGILGDR